MTLRQRQQRISNGDRAFRASGVLKINLNGLLILANPLEELSTICLCDESATMFLTDLFSSSAAPPISIDLRISFLSITFYSSSLLFGLIPNRAIALTLISLLAFVFLTLLRLRHLLHSTRSRLSL